MTWDAVVVNYDSGDHLRHCLDSLVALRDEPASSGPGRIIVVDNGSTDGSDAPAEGRADVRVLRPGRNLGYARAANLGTAASTAPIVGVFNPDIVVDRSVESLVARFDAEDDLGALGPRIHNSDGSTYPSARSVPSFSDTVGHAVVGPFRPDNASTRRYRQADTDPDIARDVDWVSGAALWLRRAALDTAGGWNERYFLYLEDVDLCDRLRERGWRVAYEPSTTVTHVQGASTATRPYRMIAEHHRSLARYASGRWRGPRRALLVVAVPALAARAGVLMGVEALRRGRGARSERRDRSGNGATGE